MKITSLLSMYIFCCQHAPLNFHIKPIRYTCTKTLVLVEDKVHLILLIYFFFIYFTFFMNRCYLQLPAWLTHASSSFIRYMMPVVTKQSDLTSIAAVQARTVLSDPVIGPVSVRSGRFTTCRLTNEKQRATELTKN